MNWLSYLNVWDRVSQLERNARSMEANLMQTKQEFLAVVAAMDAETTRIAAKLEELLTKLQEGGMTATEEAEVFASLTAQAARLKTLGVDPDNPVPA